MNECKFIETSIRWVSMDRIDDSRSNIGSMSHGFDVHPLAQSIGNVGLINPPALIREGEGRDRSSYRLVAGFRRIAALKTLSFKHIPCRFLPDDTPPMDCLLYNLHENLHTRGFNPVEKGMVLTQLMDFVSEKEVLKTYMPLLDLPSHGETLHLFMEIERVFEPLAKDLLAKGHLSMKGAKLLLKVPGPTREIFCRYFSAVGFSKNQQTQFIELIDDLSHREEITMAQLLSSHPLQDILDNEKMNNPQKANTLMTMLRRRRMPRFMEAEARFKKILEDLNLPAGVRITPPPFFEGPDYRLDILFENGQDLRRKLESLLKRAGVTSFKDPWEKRV